MAEDRIDAIDAFLTQAQEAHGVYERDELDGVYDREWPRWYAAWAVEHGIGSLLGHQVTPGELDDFLAASNADFERADPKPTVPWATYTARRIAAEL